jgi:hypothetical protein
MGSFENWSGWFGIFSVKGVCTLVQAQSYSAILLVAAYLPLVVGNGE